jgi:hypothetical protein
MGRRVRLVIERRNSPYGWCCVRGAVLRRPQPRQPPARDIARYAEGILDPDVYGRAFANCLYFTSGCAESIAELLPLFSSRQSRGDMP